MRALATLACGLVLAAGASACGSSEKSGTVPATSVSQIPTEDVRKETETQSAGTRKPALHPDTSNSVGSGGMGN